MTQMCMHISLPPNRKVMWRVSLRMMMNLSMTPSQVSVCYHTSQVYLALFPGPILKQDRPGGMASWYSVCILSSLICSMRDCGLFFLESFLARFGAL